jgi:hypothetical protein
MSRLDFHIEQKIAQRDSIDLAARRLRDRPGWVVEFGLGKGRSYSHLAARFPGRAIYCFDREDAPDPGWGPPAASLVLGDLRTVLVDPAIQARFRGQVILAHLDLARADSTDTRLHDWVIDCTREWLRPGAWVLSDRPLRTDAGRGLHPVDAAGEVAYAARFYRYEHRPG